MAKRARSYALEFRQRMVELVRAGRPPEELAMEFEPSRDIDGAIAASWAHEDRHGNMGVTMAQSVNPRASIEGIWTTSEVTLLNQVNGVVDNHEAAIGEPMDNAGDDDGRRWGYDWQLSIITGRLWYWDVLYFRDRLGWIDEDSF